MNFRPRNVVDALIVGCLLSAPAWGQKHPTTQPLATAGIAGQKVGILPLTMFVVDTGTPAGSVAGDRGVVLQWADSLVFDGSLSRAAEVEWVGPRELRKASRRSGGIVADPDHLGQAIMRTWSMKNVPDPLRSKLRKLLAAAGGMRYCFIPASLLIKGDSAGVGVELSVLLADLRTGRVVWRSIAKGTGKTSNEALAGAIATIFPLEEDK